MSNTEHIPGKLNVIFDGLSVLRDNLSWNISPQEVGLDPTLMFPAATDDIVVQFISLCDLTQELSDMSSHTELLQKPTQLLLTNIVSFASVL